MIIGDLHRMRAIIPPFKAKPPAIIDADRVLPSAIASQGFKSVSGRRTKISQRLGRIENCQFAPCRLQNIRRETSNHPIGKNRRRALVSKLTDHPLCITRHTMKRNGT